VSELHDKVGTVFQATRPVLRSALQLDFGLADLELAAAEERVLAWFRRLARRASSSSLSESALRRLLIEAAYRHGGAIRASRDASGSESGLRPQYENDGKTAPKPEVAPW
jgi:hypothetical protein